MLATTKTTGACLATRLHDREVRDEQLRQALVAMRPALPRKHPGRHLFDDVQRRTLTLARIFGMMELAASHGVPLVQLLEPSRIFDAYARHLDAQRQTTDFARPMSVRLCEEARFDAEADVAQANLLHAESPSTLRAFVDTGARHVAHMQELLGIAGAKLFSIAQRHVRNAS